MNIKFETREDYMLRALQKLADSQAGHDACVALQFPLAADAEAPGDEADEANGACEIAWVQFCVLRRKKQGHYCSISSLEPKLQHFFAFFACHFKEQSCLHRR